MGKRDVMRCMGLGVRSCTFELHNQVIRERDRDRERERERERDVKRERERKR